MRCSDGRWPGLLREFGASRSLALLEPEPSLGGTRSELEGLGPPSGPRQCTRQAQLVLSRLQVSCLRNSSV